MATYRTILTNKGIQLIAAAAANGTPIVLTDMAVGDGNGNPVTPNPAQISLARERYRSSINQLIVAPNDVTRFIAELVIAANIGGFTIREVGLYTNQGDLFAVANVPNAYKPTDAEGSFGDTVVRMIFKVDNASVVTLVADPNVTVATHTWVLNNVNAATLIPGGLTNQILSKKSNADGDVEWRDASEGVTVIVFSREETQTLAANQVNIDLAVITSEGAAVYIEGVRLRRSQFTIPTDTRITLVEPYPAGSRVTVVQNEEVGLTDVLRRPNNLSDVPDKSAARDNLGLPNWLAASNINFNQLYDLPAFVTRWPSFDEVTGKPSTYPPSAHNQDWNTIDGKPEFAVRWPTWNEVTGKPSLYPPANHTHPYLPIAGGQVDGQLQIATPGTLAKIRFGARNSAGAMRVAIEAVNNAETALTELHTFCNGARWYNPVFAQMAELTIGGLLTTAGGFNYGSSRKLKNIDGLNPYGLEFVRNVTTLHGEYKQDYCPDGRKRVFFDAEQLCEAMPEAVVEDGAEYNGERVPSVILDQMLPPAYRAIAEVAGILDSLAKEVAAMRIEIEELKRSS